jgi:hypothetical protein
VGSAPHGGLIENPAGGYRHPRGETFLSSLQLLQERGRIWNRVSPHAIGYFCSEDSNIRIQESFRGHEGYLFEQVPSRALIDLEQPPHSRWHLVWTDSPLYTLWTTGSLFFSRDVGAPQFIEAPNGLMGYIAVPDPKYYFSPNQRAENIALTELIGYFLQGGEGCPETLVNVISSVSLERRHNTEREGILFTSNLTLNENRAKILRALWDIPLEQKEEILSQFKNITKDAIRDPRAKDHSALYRILQSLVRMANREVYLTYLNEKSLLPSDDMLSTAITLETFSQLSFQEAQEIVVLFEPIYQNFRGISPRERTNLLSMIAALASTLPDKRQITFNCVLPILMPFERHEDSRNNFHDVNNNANLITIFASESQENLPLLRQQVREAIGYLTADNLSYLYPENKHFFIRSLLSFSPNQRTDFLSAILPMLALVTERHCTSYEFPMVTTKLAEIYSQPNFVLRCEYLTRQLSELEFREEGSLIRVLEMWLPFSRTYAEKRAARCANRSQ